MSAQSPKKFNRKPMLNQAEASDASTGAEQESPSVALSEKEVLAVLEAGEMVEHGLLPYSSNHSFLVTVSDGRLTLPAVYKPQRGETPLYDFEWGTLCLRETAAFTISHALGWDLTPPTVLRQGTHGVGSVQFYVDHDPNVHYFTVQADARFADTFRQLALFDLLCNNADRKSGHCLVGQEGRLWAIDHGICFHSEYKLRTVIWEFAHEPISADLLADLKELRTQLAQSECTLSQQLCHLLNEAEFEALRNRLERLIKFQKFPAPHPQRRNYPWPPV